MSQLLEQAIALHQQGQLAEAELLYRESLVRAPGLFGPHYYLGVMRMQQGRFAEAVESLRQAQRLRNDDLHVLVNLGMALRHMGKPDEAVPVLAQALALQPGLAEAHYQHAAALHETGRAAEARMAVERALALQPDHAKAAFLHAIALSDLRQTATARAAYDRVLRQSPDHVEALNNRGLLAWQAHEPEAALRDFNRALALDSRHVPSRTNRALVLGSIGRAGEALADYDRLLAHDPDHAETWNQRGAMLRLLDRSTEALDSFDQALRRNPDFAQALTNRGYLRWTLEGRYDEAKADLTRALALEPDQPWLEGELFYLTMQGADWEGYEAGRAALAARIAAGEQVIRPFAWQAVSADPASLQQCSRIFASAEFPAMPLPPPTPRAAESGESRIRIGYLSADFREQATAYLMAGVYDAQDREAFEIVGFDNGHDDQSPMRARLEKAFDRIVPITGLSDAQAAEAVRAAGIDILVNLNGWFGKPRMGVFARRAAPVQVNYLGFPATLGAPYMDYIIADRVVIPDEERRFYDEAVVWLPDCYQANDDKRVRPSPISRAEAGLPDGAFVFCNFNQGYKLAPQTFARWMTLLRRCENSVLWLLRDHDVAMERLRTEAQARGVDGARLIFAPMLPLDRHLSRVALADLFLDTLPYNAHTTASDALWAGVPLVTLRGTAFPGRVAASLLQAAGLPELITETAEDYENLAAALAQDRERLADIRARLAHNRTTCPLFDTVRFTRNLEAAYRTMMARAGATPESFAV